MTTPSRHTEWLSLVEVSGPFLAVPVLEKAFPQGLDVVETPKRQRLRAAYEEWTVRSRGTTLCFRIAIASGFGSCSEILGTTPLRWRRTPKARTYLVAPDQRDVRSRLGGRFAIEWRASPFRFFNLGNRFRDSQDGGWRRSSSGWLCRSAVRLGVITGGERWMLERP